MAVKLKQIIVKITIITVILIFSFGFINEVNTVEQEISSLSFELNDNYRKSNITMKEHIIKSTIYNTNETKQNEKVAIYKYSFSDQEIMMIERLVEAEATGQSIEAKMNVCSVIINRVNSISFPNKLEDVIYQNKQFAPVTDGRYYDIVVTDDTIISVDNVLKKGCTTSALYFFNLHDIKSQKIKNWINKNLLFLFKDDSGHSFYEERE